LATDSRSITTCVGSAGSSEVRLRFMDAVCNAYSARRGAPPVVSLNVQREARVISPR
jgi:hypothetical protein